MPEFVVAIDHITYYVVQAEDEVTAIDLVLEGQGLEISSETRDAYISEYQSSDPRLDRRAEAGRQAIRELSRSFIPDCSVPSISGPPAHRLSGPEAACR
jgi:hypothetical protein